MTERPPCFRGSSGRFASSSTSASSPSFAITLAGVIPDKYSFKDYGNPILSAWNRSFMPLDLAIGTTGLTALRRAKRGRSWRSLAFVSLVLRSCSGVMVVSFWTLHGDFDPARWLANLFLLLYPFRYLSTLMRDLEPGGFPRPKWVLLT